MKNVRETMLENKLGITDSTELARMEERISKRLKCLKVAFLRH